MFEEDDLSKHHNDYLEVDFTTKYQINDIFRKIIGEKPNSIKMIKGYGIKSLNYEINTLKDKFILKSRSGTQSNYSDLEKEGQIAFLLKKNNIPVSVPIRINDKFTFRKYNNNWQIFNYIEGVPLKNEKQFISVAYWHASLFKVLNKSKTKYLKPNKIQFKKIIEMIKLYFPDDYIGYEKLITYSLPLLDEILNFNSITHSDLHPKNLILDNEKVLSIIDFEDVKSYPINSSFGFSSYKLGRELIRKNNMSKLEWIKSLEKWIDCTSSVDNKLSFTIPKLGLGCIYRVLDNLGYAIEHLQYRDNLEFEYAIRKQSRSLLELEWMFNL